MAVKLKLSDIKPNPNNPRLIKDDKFKKLVQSLKDFPEMAEVREIVVNKDNVILGGNMRFKAMQEAGWREAPVKIVDWPEDKQRQFIIKDNVAGGEWDWDLLANEWDSQQLDDWGLDLPAQFGDEEVVEDEAPPVANVAISKLGEVYQLGKHRLMCGDSTDFGAVSDLMDGSLADMTFTDPPYNVDYGESQSPIWKKEVAKIQNDNMSPEAWQEFITGWMTNIMEFTKGAYYICMSCKEWPSVQGKFAELGGHWSTTIIFNKDHFVPGRADYQRKYEPILYGWKEGTKHYYSGDRRQSDVWDIKRSIRNDQHPTMKPIELCGRAINNSSKTRDIVLDLFGGSGSTLIACEQLDRTCYMMELDPKYCDVIRKRYAKFIGEEDWQAVTPVITEGAPTNG